MATIASLIIDIGANVTGLQQDVERVNSTLDTVTGTAGKLAGALGITFSVGAVVAFAREIASFASDMEDASAKTGIGVEQLQALNYAASGAGVSVDQITSAVAQLSKRLVGGDDGAANALEKLGLNVAELLDMDPADAFLTISERIAGMQNPMQQAAAAMAIFGKSGADLLPAMKEDLRGLMDQARSTGAVMDADLIKKAGAFDDAWDHGVITMKSWGAQAIEMVSAIEGFTSPIQAAVTSFQEFRGTVGGLTEDMEHLIDRMLKQPPAALAFVRETDNLAMSTYELEKANKELEAQEKKNIKIREDHAKAVDKALESHRAFVNFVGEREIETIKADQEAFEEWLKTVIKADFESANAQIEWAQQSAEAYEQAAQASEEWYRAVHDDMSRHEHDMIAHQVTLGEVWNSMKSDLGGFMEFAGQQIGGRLGGLIGDMGHAWQDGRTVVKGILGIMHGDFSGFIDGIMAGVRLAGAAIRALKDLFSNAVEHANDTRDQFINSNFGDGQTLAALLTSLGAGDGGGDLYHNLIGASDVAGVNTAKAAIEQFLHSNNVPGFAAGTFGQYLDFGAGKLAMLHGRERVVTESEGRGEWSMVSSALNRMAAALERQSRTLPAAISDAVALAR